MTAERTCEESRPAPSAYVSDTATGFLRRWLVRSASAWLGGARLGLVVMALVVGAGAGLGAAVFREMIFGSTWLATGYTQFGQQGHAPSLHLPSLGIFFVLVVPVVGGLLYGPLVQRFAREARGHGVPEVMLAVAENGGRIRPQVTIVKALASAIMIGTGGSVGREGPIVQIGSALASTLGQLVRMSENRLRIIVACGAAGGIAATFNAPITGLFFGFEIVLREFSLDALFATSLAAVTGDVITRALFGSAPFFTEVPHDLLVVNDSTYLLVAVLAIAAGLIGLGFKTFLYWLEDLVDELWKGRPEWARPAVGGVALGLVLLALPQMYGVGYPVMGKAFAGQYALWFIVILMLGKILAVKPDPLDRRLGRGVRPLAVHRRDARDGVRDGRAPPLRAPRSARPRCTRSWRWAECSRPPRRRRCTAIASVAEMTGNFSLTLPIMLAAGIARGGIQATHLRQHLHHQAAAARDRYRAAKSDQCAAAPHRRRCHATHSATQGDARLLQRRSFVPNAMRSRMSCGNASRAR